MNNLGQYYGSENPSCFMKFKAYLDSKAEFDVNVEYEDVKERFFNGYFRDAAEPMLRYFNELTNMTILTEEVGELARIMARTYGEQSFKESDTHRDLGDEMADILWVLICLANQTGIDLTAAFEKNITKKTDRDKERHLHNQKLQAE